MQEPEYYCRELCENIAVKIRELVFDDADDITQSAMVADPLEVYGFALEWIKKQKNLKCRENLFKCKQNQNTTL